MLQALPNTGLWQFASRRGPAGCRQSSAKASTRPTCFNFGADPPIREIAHEYVDAFCALYDQRLHDRVYHYLLRWRAPAGKSISSPPMPKAKLPKLDRMCDALGIVVWRQGIKRDNPRRFLRLHVRHCPQKSLPARAISSCAAHNEHFMEYRSWSNHGNRSQLKRACLPSCPPELTADVKSCQPSDQLV